MNSNKEMQIEEIVSGMDSISLKEMDHVKLMKRRDTKYVLPLSKLPTILNGIKDKYRVLEIEEGRLHPYQTLYYDTPAYEMYHNHHNSRLNRYKVRVREYLTSNDVFLEVKFKNNKRETIKKRIQPESVTSIRGNDSEEFLKKNSPYQATEIEPALENRFSRITLVHKSTPERITIDLHLEFSDSNKQGCVELPNVSIIEVKRDRDSQKSDMELELRRNRISTMGFSKYCIGTALIKPSVKTNLFKSRLRKINSFNRI